MKVSRMVEQIELVELSKFINRSKLNTYLQDAKGEETLIKRGS